MEVDRSGKKSIALRKYVEGFSCQHGVTPPEFHCPLQLSDIEFIERRIRFKAAGGKP
jgi:hypothetical protein